MEAIPVANRGRKRFFKLIRLAISLGLLGYLLSKIEFSEVISALSTADPLWLGLAIAMLAIGKIIIGTRWRLLIEAQGVKIPLTSLISSILIGIFFGSLLPTRIGGDAVRAYDVANKGNVSFVSGLGSVLIDRILGVLGLALFAAMALLLARGALPASGAYALLVLVVLLAGIAILATLGHASTMEWILRKLRGIRLEAFSNKIAELGKSVGLIVRSGGVILIGLILSLVLQVVVVIQYALLGASLGLEIPLSYFFVAVPVALLILLLPASIGGIGLREAVFVFLLGNVAVSPHDAIALSWLAFGFLLLQAVVGGILFLLRGRPNVQQTKPLAVEHRS